MNEGRNLLFHLLLSVMIIMYQPGNNGADNVWHVLCSVSFLKEDQFKWDQSRNLHKFKPVSLINQLVNNQETNIQFK